METKITIKLINIVTIFLFIISCKSKESMDYESELKKLTNDIYYKVIYKNDSICNIEWGNSFIKNESSEINISANTNLNLIDYSDSCIVLGQSCGTSCSSYIFLPIREKATEEKYLFTIAYDLNNYLVAYIPNDSTFVRIENFISNKKMNINESNLCSAAFSADCIDSCSFNNQNNTFYLKWEGMNWNNKNYIPFEKVYNIILK